MSVSRNQLYSLRKRKNRVNSIESFMGNHLYFAMTEEMISKLIRIRDFEVQRKTGDGVVYNGIVRRN